MFHIKIPLYQTPSYRRSKIFIYDTYKIFGKIDRIELPKMLGN